MMRGGPRMMCSPYLTGSLAVMLVLVTFNYWSVSTNNFDLVKETQKLQAQLKSGSGTIQDKDNEVVELKEKLKNSQISMQKQLEHVREDLQQACVKESDKSAAKAREEKELLQKKGNDLDSEVDDLNKQISELNIQLENSKTDLEKANNGLDNVKSELLQTKSELDSTKNELSQSQKEVLSLKAQQLTAPGHARNLGAPPGSGGLGMGQLGDVDPNAIHVVKKDSLGGSGLKLSPLATGPSSPKPLGISSSKLPVLVDNVPGVMPPPNNLDQAEDDSHRPENENGPEGKKDLQDDDQNPNGEIDEHVDLDKQQFLEDKAAESGLETKDMVVEGHEDDGKDVVAEANEDVNMNSLNDLKQSLNTRKSET